MVREINKDISTLKLKSVEATLEDVCVGNDLLDTLKFHKAGCVGMAANMIGVSKRIIAFEDSDGKYMVMYNPVILAFSGKEYDAEEGCLSLTGTRHAKRNTKIKVGYYDSLFRYRIKNYTDFTAQIIMHELDHLEGIII